jgi:hypothetical protein
MTTPTAASEKKEKKRMAKTAQPKNVEIDGKAYLKCPHPDCNHMVRDWGYDPKSDLRRKMLSSPNDIYGHLKNVHGLVWLSKGGRSGWHQLSSFRHPNQGGRREMTNPHRGIIINRRHLLGF